MKSRHLPEPEAAARLVLVWTLVVGVVSAAVAFGFKIAGFIHALSSSDFRGTFDVGITVYFFVSAGWLCLLVWCWLTRKFQRMEETKHELLQREEEYERLGI
jgi:hypothetical protein